MGAPLQVVSWEKNKTRRGLPLHKKGGFQRRRSRISIFGPSVKVQEDVCDENRACTSGKELPYDPNFTLRS